MPLEVLQSYHVDYYDAQVKNGGHEQFISNSTSEQNIIFNDVDAGLTSMNAHKHLAIFRAVRTYARESPERMAGIVERAGFGKVDEWIKSQDHAFFDLAKTDDLPNLNNDWLRKLKCLRVVPDTSWKDEIKRVIESNPLRLQRFEKMGRKSIPDFESDLVPKNEEVTLVDRLVRDLCPLVGCQLVFVKSAGIAFPSSVSILARAIGEDVSKFAGQ